ncbi:UvrD-helicase domain-containing protein [Rhizoctonia solani AG-1 IA]|uniref:DNA 3'-5' helicase n=1 Tax=Thanatephorus cucumeris (strain AG1-IA) TaxID=983506 RepID=L8WNE1_THACA|nr:UvrD-helicase domain-containing protein [Rhizoctonia solani AG-1 IA]
MFSNVKEKVKITPGAAIDSMIKEELKRKREDHNSSAHDSPQIQLQSKLLLELYYSYSHTLRASNALDFTDLLSKGLDLLQAVPWAREVGRLKHVLVDEFQDTSSLQYLIVKELFKATRGSISVVVYKWRGADLPKTKEIYLEENYRSTASIIKTAIDIISQDETRPPKALFTSYTPHGPKPVKKSLDIKHEEEAYIVEEINRIVTNSAETIDYGDCAILFRDNRSADQFSQVLFKAGIPYRQLPEPSLMEQFEVISLIAFLRLAINDAHTPMVIRALKGPLALDEKAITDLMTRSAGHRITLFDALQRVRGGYDRDTNPSCISASNLLTRILRHLRDFMHQGASPADLLHYIIEATNYHEFLMQNFTKNYSRRARNVQRTIQYAKPMPVRLFLDFMRELSRVDDFNTGVSSNVCIHLGIDSNPIQKVTLLTCHSAKGLEWPVVFVPSVVDGVYPHHKSQSIISIIDVPRRLLYVACTRAQCLLYLTRSETKLINQRALTIFATTGIPVEVQQYESEFTEHLLPVSDPG